jgi:O-antigen/teichoic acid export membrane protein
MAELKQGIGRRLTLGVSGQAFSRIVIALNTVVLVPVLVRAWGVGGYGQWIALTALATFMAYSNFGIVTTSANEMVMAAGAGDHDRARRTFQMSLNLTLYVVLPIILVVLGLAAVTPISQILRLTAISNRGALLILIFVAVQFWFQTARGLMVAALYATGHYGIGYYLAGAARLVELAGITIVVTFFHGTQVAAAAVMGGVAVVDAFVIAVITHRAAPWARMDLRNFDWAWVGQQAKPSVGFALSNLATMGVLIQGPRIVLAAILGGQAVAVYAIYGAAMRLMDQLLLMVVLPLEVEIAHSVGRKAIDQTYRLVSLGTQFSWLLFMAVASFLMLFGPLIFHFWTRGQIPFSYGLMALYLLMSACNQLGRVSAHALISTNRLYGLSFWTLGASLAALGVGALLTFPLKIDGMVIGGILGELGNSLIFIVVLTRWMDRPLSGFLLDQLNMSDTFAFARTRAMALLQRVRGAA